MTLYDSMARAMAEQDIPTPQVEPTLDYIAAQHDPCEALGAAALAGMAAGPHPCPTAVVAVADLSAYVDRVIDDGKAPRGARDLLLCYAYSLMRYESDTLEGLLGIARARQAGGDS